MRRWLVLAGLTLAVASVLAQVPASELAKPPAGARHFVIQSTGESMATRGHGSRPTAPAWGARA